MRQLASGRRLVIIADAGERLQRAGARLGVMALGVAALADLGRRCDIDLAERRVGDAARGGAIIRRRRHRGDDGDMAVARQMGRDFGEPADVFGAVLRGETEIAVEAGAQRVAVEQDRRTAAARTAGAPARAPASIFRSPAGRSARSPRRCGDSAPSVRRGAARIPPARCRSGRRAVRRRPTARDRRRRCGR